MPTGHRRTLKHIKHIHASCPQVLIYEYYERVYNLNAALTSLDTRCSHATRLTRRDTSNRSVSFFDARIVCTYANASASNAVGALCTIVQLFPLVEREVGMLTMNRGTTCLSQVCLRVRRWLPCI